MNDSTIEDQFLRIATYFRLSDNLITVLNPFFKVRFHINYQQKSEEFLIVLNDHQIRNPIRKMLLVLFEKTKSDGLFDSLSLDDTIHLDLESVKVKEIENPVASNSFWLNISQDSQFQDLPVIPDERIDTNTDFPTIHTYPLKQNFSPIERYKQLDILGKGGMSCVYRVLDKIFNRKLAMKVLNEKQSQNPTTYKRFIEEAQIMGQLQHPSIVPIYDIGVLGNGCLYYTMKEVRGTRFDMYIRQLHKSITMKKWQLTQQGWSFSSVLKIFYQVCRTMGYAHSKKVLHRDLKPSNILVGRHDDFFVMDWGIAKLQENQSTFNLMESMIWLPEDAAALTDDPTKKVILGTPSYMSPEQAFGSELGPQSDVYALGAILYFLLTGQVFQMGKSPLDTVKKLRLGLYRPPFANRSIIANDKESIRLQSHPKLPLISTLLFDVCDKALQFNPEKRFNDASEMADVLYWCLE